MSLLLSYNENIDFFFYKITFTYVKFDHSQKAGGWKIRFKNLSLYLNRYNNKIPQKQIPAISKMSSKKVAT